MARPSRSSTPATSGAPAAPEVRHDAAASAPVGDLPTGSRPAAAAFIAPDPGASTADRLAEEHAHPAPFDLSKPSWGEQHEPKPNRPRDLINEAVGSDFYQTDYADAGWAYAVDGWPFVVTRYYPHARIAIDFLRDWRDVERQAEKAKTVEAAGIAYCAIAPRESLNVNDMRTRIAESLRRLPRKES